MSFEHTTFCANGTCETEAVYLTPSGMPLCYTCGSAFEMGRDTTTPGPLNDLDGHMTRPDYEHVPERHNSHCELPLSHAGACGEAPPMEVRHSGIIPARGHRVACYVEYGNLRDKASIFCAAIHEHREMRNA